MFPLRDDNPQILRPVATCMLLACNLAAWFYLQGAGTEPALSTSICRLGLIPGVLLQRIPDGLPLALGPGTGCLTGEVQALQTTVTSMFLHGGWFHLLGNLWFLWIFGNNVEDAMGHLRFTAFYLLCGLAAAGAQVASHPESAIPMVGASGAVGGVMGAYVLLYPRVHVHLLVVLGFYITRIAVPAVLMLGYWFVLQFMGGLAGPGGSGGGVAFWAHVGGFAAGAVLMPLFRDSALLAMHPYHGWRPRGLPTRSWQRIRRF